MKRYPPRKKKVLTENKPTRKATSLIDSSSFLNRVIRIFKNIIIFDFNGSRTAGRGLAVGIIFHARFEYLKRWAKRNKNVVRKSSPWLLMALSRRIRLRSVSSSDDQSPMLYCT
jgi:hypothetical protein